MYSGRKKLILSYLCKYPFLGPMQFVSYKEGTQKN